MKYKAKTFNLKDIKGISDKQISVHIGLYEGYVKQINTLYDLLEKFKSDEKVIPELRRRIGFELGGLKNHELYFSVIENGPKKVNKESDFNKKIEKQFGSFDKFIEEIRKTSVGTRGVGWVLLLYDKSVDMFHITWVGDHELGAVFLPALLAVDMWEHAFMVDYVPKEKGNYVDAYIEAINWNLVEENFLKEK